MERPKTVIYNTMHFDTPEQRGMYKYNSAKIGTWLILKSPLSPSSNIFRLIKEHKPEKENKEEITLPEIFRH